MHISIVLYTRLTDSTLWWLCMVIDLEPAGLLIIKPCILCIFPDHCVEIIIFVDTTIVEIIILAMDESFLQKGSPQSNPLLFVCY